ncbi:MAG: hypothetical protein M4579_000382 [Chaenotheca gracillima]|nr:MAG: hypothetical protein M4579_000382 [Chaenotheca gracillima]
MTADHENDLILVTTASGKQATQLLTHLHGSWKRLRLVVNSTSSEERLKKQYPNAEVTRADLADSGDVARILKGVTSLFHNCPPFHPKEAEMTFNMIEAAVQEFKNGGFKHFVFSSVLNPQLHKMLHHNDKKYMEAYLMESGLPFTILQPTHFMDLFPIPVVMSQDEPVYPARWDPNIEFSYIAVRDIGEAAAKVLDEREKHFYAQYPMTGPDPPMGYTEVCKIVGQQIGKEITIKQLPFEEAVDSFMGLMFGKGEEVHPYARDCAERMLLFYNRRGLVGNSNVLEWLLGRKPTSYAEWVQLRMKEVKA